MQPLDEPFGQRDEPPSRNPIPALRGIASVSTRRIEPFGWWRPAAEIKSVGWKDCRAEGMGADLPPLFRSPAPMRQAAQLVAPILPEAHEKPREPVSLGRMHAHELDSKMPALRPTDDAAIHLKRPRVIRHDER